MLTALLSLLLGMGLPTTANYIVVATLLAPVIVSLAASHGLEVPLIAVHLFVFYFGIMADATPPVALAAYAAAGLSGADPLKTGIQGFLYEMRTAILPFVFIFNTELLLIDIGSPLHLVWIVGISIIACFSFAAATQRHFLVSQPLVGVDRAAVRRVHAVPAGHLSRHVLSAVLGAARGADAARARRRCSPGRTCACASRSSEKTRSRHRSARSARSSCR